MYEPNHHGHGSQRYPRYESAEYEAALRSSAAYLRGSAYGEISRLRECLVFQDGLGKNDINAVRDFIMDSCCDTMTRNTRPPKARISSSRPACPHHDRIGNRTAPWIGRYAGRYPSSGNRHRQDSAPCPTAECEQAHSWVTAPLSAPSSYDISAGYESSPIFWPCAIQTPAGWIKHTTLYRQDGVGNTRSLRHPLAYSIHHRACHTSCMRP